VTSWMMDVCEYFSLHPTTIHAAIAYLDRLQPSDKHSRYEWKMFVVCCILISGENNENFHEQDASFN
jgi:Cyclin, N-terminal domain